MLNVENYKNQRNRIKKLYKIRSKYVHEGKAIPQETIHEIEVACYAVALSLLRYQIEIEHQNAGVDVWLKGIDVIVAYLEAGKSPPTDLLIELAISD